MFKKLCKIIYIYIYTYIVSKNNFIEKIRNKIKYNNLLTN